MTNEAFFNFISKYGIALLIGVLAAILLSNKITELSRSKNHESTYDVNALRAGDTIYLHDQKFIISELTVYETLDSGFIKLEKVEY
jgi:hypothetical protein